GGKSGVTGHVREDPQLDLRVVRGEQHEVGATGDERSSNAATEWRADRDVLKVRVLAREPAGRGDRLIEGGVQPARVGIDERAKTFGVRRAELLDLAVLEDLVDHRVRGAQLLEDRCIRRVARGGPP